MGSAEEAKYEHLQQGIGENGGDTEKTLMLQAMKQQYRLQIVQTILLVAVIVLLAIMALGAKNDLDGLHHNMGKTTNLLGSTNSLMLVMTSQLNTTNARMDIMTRLLADTKSLMNVLNHQLNGTNERMDFMITKLNKMDQSMEHMNKMVEATDTHTHNIVYNTYALCALSHPLHTERHCHDDLGYNKTNPQLPR
eukprot:CAMPEP_0170199068 /NCGR_PEP_ID=MMETSP0040_2-20121228/69134_1 /TAXON_ID=641309 /ORGANISM="Lotharella oceanica, Strain CCMP622" /LENGTH=193 /DNA_ID=CAMNT_0010449151 /DNA_START=75 /DNA_END=656 /DNA_ORIENTATION=+